jgi:hypothetical protein
MNASPTSAAQAADESEQVIWNRFLDEPGVHRSEFLSDPVLSPIINPRPFQL